MKPGPSIIALPLLLLAAGCMWVRIDTNEPIDAAVVRAFRIGETTAREVTERLGAPVDVVQIGHRSAYHYEATLMKETSLYMVVVTLGNYDTRSDRVWLFFDEKDVLTHQSATFAVHRPRYAMPWVDVHDAEGDAARDATRPGLSR